ncbi:MAG: transposase [Mesorhizobium sp.]|nr:MAG: transposase [Mesorhizobium sp.]
MTAHVPQGSPGIEQMCRLAGVSRAGYYRHWRQSASRQEETGLRDVIQRLALANRHYGYRRIGALLGREGWQVNHKRVLRVMGEDNLLCLRTRPFVPRTTDSRHSWRVVPNLARGMELTGVNQLWVPTSRICTLPSSSPIWRLCSMHSVARSSDGRSNSTCGPALLSMP